MGGVRSLEAGVMPSSHISIRYCAVSVDVKRLAPGLRDSSQSAAISQNMASARLSIVRRTLAASISATVSRQIALAPAERLRGIFGACAL